MISAPVVMGKPILPELYRGVENDFDGLFLLGLHTMQHTGELLAHIYLREYDAIYLNGILVGEIGIEAAMAAKEGVSPDEIDVKVLQKTLLDGGYMLYNIIV